MIAAFRLLLWWSVAFRRNLSSPLRSFSSYSSRIVFLKLFLIQFRFAPRSSEGILGCFPGFGLRASDFELRLSGPGLWVPKTDEKPGLSWFTFYCQASMCHWFAQELPRKPVLPERGLAIELLFRSLQVSLITGLISDAIYLIIADNVSWKFRSHQKYFSFLCFRLAN